MAEILERIAIDASINPRHCPFCGSWKIKPAQRIVDRELEKFSVFLKCDECQATGPIAGSQRAAAEKWGLKNEL